MKTKKERENKKKALMYISIAKLGIEEGMFILAVTSFVAIILILILNIF